MKFNHLNVPTHWRNYWTRYPEGHTILEALISWVSQVDSMVDNVNSWNDYLVNFVDTFDKELQQTVTDTLSDWQNSGFLDVVISEALQWQLDDYIATNEADKLSLTAQLAQVHENILDVELFRFDDGLELNDNETFTRALNHALVNGKELHLFRDYTLTSFTIPSQLTVYGHMHTIFNEGSGEIFIELTPSVGTEADNKITLKDLVIDCPNYNYGIVNRENTLFIENVTVRKAKMCNVKYIKELIKGNGTIDILNSETSPVGLDLSATDVKVFRYKGKNCLTHIDVRGGGTYLEGCHGWGLNGYGLGDWVTGSTFIKARAPFTMNNCYADTVETALELPVGTNTRYILISVNNFGYFLNRSYYPEGHPTSPKLVRNVDGFKGQLSMTNIQADNSSWKDTEGTLTELLDGEIDHSRMTIIGLTNNGFLDKDNLLVRKGDATSYLSNVVNTYVSAYSRQYFLHKNIKKISVAGSLKTSIPPDAVVYSATLLAPFNAFDLSAKGRAFIKNGNVIYNLSWFVEDGNITIINDNSSSISAGTFYLFLEHHAE